MIEINPQEWKTSPFAHQLVGTKFLLKNPVAALGDKPGSGKSKQFVDTACILWRANEIDLVLIVAPAGVKSTWGSLEFGQIAQHSWVPSLIEEYNAKNCNLAKPLALDQSGLHWVITNYEFIRNDDRLLHLIQQLKNIRIMVVFDESSYIKSHRAAQTKAAKKLRAYCQRAYLANGSLISESLIDLYAPFAVLDKNIIGCENYWAFRGRYCQMGGYQNKQIIDYRNVEQLQERLKPYILYRRKEDCFDLPPKMYSTVEVPLTESTWKTYKELREEMITWLDEQTPLITMSAIVKIVRLSQLTSGMVGGLNRSLELMKNLGLASGLLFQGEEANRELEEFLMQEEVRVISSEKHDWVVSWLKDRIEEDQRFRVILWTRFRKEQEILKELIGSKYADVLRIHGGQKKSERENVLVSFNSPSSRPMVLLGQQRAGGIGLNLQAMCNWAVYVSNDYSAFTREQSEDRIHRAGQLASTVNYLDIIATGPNGQKTIDHAIRKALLSKDAFAMKTTEYWRAAIAA